MSKPKADIEIVSVLLGAIFLWGGNNAATKLLLGYWPPIFVGCTRFLFAGVILLLVFKYTSWLGPMTPVSADTKRALWLRLGLTLAAYIVAFNCALAFSTAPRVALYLGTAPVWALLWEERFRWDPKIIQRYAGAVIAFIGVVVLFWPGLRKGSSMVVGDLLALVSSILWTQYGRQCRYFSKTLRPAEVSAAGFWRAGLLALPLVALEIMFGSKSVHWRNDLVAIQSGCIVCSGVFAFILWNHALRHWTTSKVYLFNNLIPVSTMLWARVILHDRVPPSFWIAMVMIAGGVILGQVAWRNPFAPATLPQE